MAVEYNVTGHKTLNGSLIISSFLSDKTHGNISQTVLRLGLAFGATIPHNGNMVIGVGKCH